MSDRYERFRDRAHNQMVNILNFAKAITAETSLEAIKTRLEVLEARYETFNEMELQLTVNADYKSITEEVDNLYYKARELLTRASGTQGRSGLDTKSDFNNTLEQFVGQQKTFYENVNTPQHMRLPKIHIEPFSGDPKYWASFHDVFKTTVHNNHSISDVHKLKMLNGLLKGEAKCFSKSSCLICHKRHHTLLHQRQAKTSSGYTPKITTHHSSVDQRTDERLSSEHKTEKSSKVPNESLKVPINLNNQINAKVLHVHYSSITTVIPTAVIYIMSRTGKLQLYRALLDSGSHTSFVTETCAQSLGLKRNHASLSVYGLASAPAGRTRGKIDMTIISRIEPNYKLLVTAPIINSTTNVLPSKPINFNQSDLQLELADPQFHTPNKNDVPLGADVFFKVLNPHKQIIDGLPVLQSSKLGWLVAGSCHNSSTDVTNLHVISEPKFHAKIQIPRCLTQSTTTSNLQIHAFVRSIDKSGKIIVNIITAKSKGALVEQILLPRLELCGAVLLCKLIKFCVASLSYRDIEVCAWTDSMIVLHWLSDVSRRWKGFIGNRTAAVLEIIPRHKWHHIDSKQNPIQ